MTRKQNPALSAALIATMATAAVGVAGFARGAYVDYRRIKLRRFLGLEALKQLTFSKPGAFTIPFLTKTKTKTHAEQLDENLRAFFALAEIYAVEWKDNMYRVAIEKSRDMWAEDTYGRKHGPRLPGLLYSWVMGFASYGKNLWDTQPNLAVLRAESLVDLGIEWGITREEQGKTINLGNEGEGPSVTELAEDYAKDAAITYLASAIPGGALVLAIAEFAGIGWTSGSGRQTVPKGADIPDDRAWAIAAADTLIAHAFANPAPASTYPSGQLP